MAVRHFQGTPGPNDVPGVIPPGTQIATYSADTPAANTAAVITIAAVAGKRHHLVFLAWSYSATPTGGEIYVQDGASVLLDLLVPNEWAESFYIPCPGIVGTENTAMTATVAAGGAGISGSVTAGYYTA